MSRATKRGFVGRAVFGLLFLVLVAVGSVLIRWSIANGPSAAVSALARLIRYGPTTVDDFKHYPSRRLFPAEEPFRFAAAGGESGIPETVILPDGSQWSLERLLRENDTLAFLVIQDDAIVLERYYQGHTADSISQLFSVSKSVLSALVGMAIEDGYILSADQQVTDFIPEYVGWDGVTLRHLMTMASGLHYVENDNPFQVHILMNYTNSLERMIRGFRITGRPGETFAYKSGDTAVVSLALDRALGRESLTEYAQRRLWTPLGMESGGVWSLDREGGLEKAWCCLAMSARDLAKIGRLYLSGGEWNGDSLLSKEWVEDSTVQWAFDQDQWSDDFRSIGLSNYGYYWWLVSSNERDFLALGKDGQYLYVNPERRLIVVRLGRSEGDLFTSGWLSVFRQMAPAI